MTLARLKDHSGKKAIRRIRKWSSVIAPILRSRSIDPDSGIASNLVLLKWAKGIHKHITENNRIVKRTNFISMHSFTQHRFPYFSDAICLSLFRFRRTDIMRMVPVIGWPYGATHTTRNRYGLCPLLATCILLRRMATPARWVDLEETFYLQYSHLSEIFWEVMHNFIEERAGIVLEDMNGAFWKERFFRYAQSIKDKSMAISNCVGFIDGTVIGIARPSGDQIMQRVCYNGHKRKHGLKYQAVTSPCGLAMHLCGPMEGRRHDWTLYMNSGLERSLPHLMNVNNEMYCIYGDSGYSARWFLYIPFSGSNICESRRKFNEYMSKSRVTVEWYFKEVKLYWTILDFKRKLRVNEGAVGKLYIAGVLLTNFRNCVYPNTISQYFKEDPPTLEEYVYHRE